MTLGALGRPVALFADFSEEPAPEVGDGALVVGFGLQKGQPDSVVRDAIGDAQRALALLADIAGDVVLALSDEVGIVELSDLGLPFTDSEASP